MLKYIELTLTSKWDGESNIWIGGSDQLEVYSSGKDPMEALERGKEAILLFLDTATRNGTVWEILEESGVEVTAIEPKPSDFLGIPKKSEQGFFGIPTTFPISPTVSAAG